MKKRRKKVCPICGRKLWLRDFYRQKEGRPSSYCKECTSQWKRKWYETHGKRPDGVFLRQDCGRLMEHKGRSLRLFWSANMLSILKRHYPTSRTAEVAEMLGISASTAHRKAKELGLTKDREYMRAMAMETLLLASNTGRKSKAGWFQKGRTAWNKGMKEADNI